MGHFTSMKHAITAQLVQATANIAALGAATQRIKISPRQHANNYATAGRRSARTNNKTRAVFSGSEKHLSRTSLSRRRLWGFQ